MTTQEVAEKVGLSEKRVRQAAPKYAEKRGRDWYWTPYGVKMLEIRKGQRGHKLS